MADLRRSDGSGQVSRIWQEGDAWMWEAVCPDGTLARGISQTRDVARCFVLMHEHPDVKVRFPSRRLGLTPETENNGL